MDDIVRRALARWPDVPDAYGWLALDQRGHWLIKGERVANPGVVNFINRNYAADSSGRWFFQNGPQRVFVQLACAPFVYRWIAEGDGGSLVTHTGEAGNTPTGIWIDDVGRVIISTAAGVGNLDDRDLAEFAERLLGPAGLAPDEELLSRWIEGHGTAGLSVRLENSVLPIRSIAAADLPARFGFVPCPRPAPGQPDC